MSNKKTQGYICPATKEKCNDECCVSAEQCHLQESQKSNLKGNQSTNKNMFGPIKIACSYIRYRLLKWKLRSKSPVIQDLFENDHDLCLCCGELYFKSNPKHKYCSRVCQRRHYYILNKK